MRGFFLIILSGVWALAGCGGGSSGSGGNSTVPTVAVSPVKGQTLSQNSSLKITALVTGDQGQGVTWSVTGPGSLSNQAFSSVTYTAPSTTSDIAYAVVTATSVADSRGSGYVPVTVLPQGVFGNVQPVAVDGGPVSGQVYPNGGFTSVTICTPGTLTCSTIGGILVDTGSSGLRVLASALPSLPVLTDGKGNPVSECAQFVDQSYLWGNVAVADVRIAGEVASSISIQAIADPTNFTIPSDCTSGGAGIDHDNQLALGANGILGVGLEPQDCGITCDPTSGNPPPAPAYYVCAANACNPTFVLLPQQVTHPAVFFPKDNNGVALQFSPLSGAAPTLSGSLTFGIGTQTNNTVGNATIFTLDLTNQFTTNVFNTGQSLPFSSIDSGLSGIFFPDGGLPICPSPSSSLFCPTSPTVITALNIGSNSAQSMINFTVDNADNLFSGNPADAAFSTLAGPGGSAACTGGSQDCSFAWGLPFFYGRTVFTAITGQSMPSTAPPAPWWAYTIGFVPQ